MPAVRGVICCLSCSSFGASSKARRHNTSSEVVCAAGRVDRVRVQHHRVQPRGAAGHVRGVQDRAGGPDQGAGPGAGAARHSSELHSARRANTAHAACYTCTHDLDMSAVLCTSVRHPPMMYALLYHGRLDGRSVRLPMSHDASQDHRLGSVLIDLRLRTNTLRGGARRVAGREGQAGGDYVASAAGHARRHGRCCRVPR